jgi:uncharacterized protein YbjT (DUF2867 family)
MPETVLVAGATGSLGREIVRVLAARGQRIRVLSRRPDAASAFPGIAGLESARGDVLDRRTLAGACDGVETVLSTVGASLDLYAWRDRLPYSQVDSGGNIALLDAARASGVRRFVYVSVLGAPGFEQTRYVQAHRAVERALEASGIEHRIVRPTGFFGFLDELLPMARRGFAPVIGDGSARTNPIDERDLAEIVAGAFDGSERVVAAGGPEVLERREIAGLAGEAAGRKVRIVRSPPAVWTGMSKLMGSLQPRLAELFEFAVCVATNDGIAPQLGRRRLLDHFREVVAASATGARR